MKINPFEFARACQQVFCEHSGEALNLTNGGCGERCFGEYAWFCKKCNKQLSDSIKIGHTTEWNESTKSYYFT